MEGGVNRRRTAGTNLSLKHKCTRKKEKVNFSDLTEHQ